jgi:hypothetical protein
MEAATQTPHGEHAHHEMPTSGRALTGVALSATLHCLTGCAIGEVMGMVIGTALGFSDWGTIGLAVALAFLFGYALTSLPLLRAGLALAVVVPIALASDTISIAIMEIVDNAIMLAIPGAMHAGIGTFLFWGSLSVALVIAGAFAVPFNRWLIARGKGHAAVHETGIHGGPPVRLVGAVAAVAAVFGTTVLLIELIDTGDKAAGRERAASSTAGAGGQPEGVRGLGVSAGGMTLSLGRTELPRGGQAELRFRILGSDGRPVRDFEVEHEKRMHLIVARRDLTGFQHLHPELGRDGTWHTPVTISQAGSYRVFADFKRHGSNQTLAADLGVDGPVDWQQLPAAGDVARTEGGYEIRLQGASTAGRESELRFTVLRDGRSVSVEPYLGAGGHLVALRQGDLAYLHVHPTGQGGPGGSVAFATEFPTQTRYRLFLQFKHGGSVHTAAFTRDVAGGSGGGTPAAPERHTEGGGHG